MPDIIESGKWGSSIPLITRTDRVEGGKSGLVNIQTEILANRTQYLKWISESLQNAIYIGGSGVALYSTEGVLRQSIPDEGKYLAIDQSTGRYYVWDTSVIPLQDETTAYLARMTTQPTAIQKAAINRLYPVKT